ncbi:MAG: hypothetical protein QOF89_3193 [Acidobacteriota bacterium]|jgi:hypothetical protein|nr:hypothetical protein [Acidobacteriota bacterium]
MQISQCVGSAANPTVERTVTAKSVVPAAHLGTLGAEVTDDNHYANNE